MPRSGNDYVGGRSLNRDDAIARPMNAPDRNTRFSNALPFEDRFHPPADEGDGSLLQHRPEQRRLITRLCSRQPMHKAGNGPVRPGWPIAASTAMSDPAHRQIPRISDVDRHEAINHTSRDRRCLAISSATFRRRKLRRELWCPLARWLPSSAGHRMPATRWRLVRSSPGPRPARREAYLRCEQPFIHAQAGKEHDSNGGVVHAHPSTRLEASSASRADA